MKNQRLIEFKKLKKAKEKMRRNEDQNILFEESSDEIVFVHKI